MKILRGFALIVLLIVVIGGLSATWLAPHPYDSTYRAAIDAPPSAEFPMGTDAIGHDRLSRLIYATRTSILLAPAAAAVSVILALLISLLRPRLLVSGLVTVSLSLPWLFLFILLRAELPLNTAPLISLLLTFGLMGVAGWAWPARVFSVTLLNAENAGWMMQARAAGLSRARIAFAHLWPHLRSNALAQFCVLIPAYILSEASLGLLGLGVSEPLPSWGNLLRELQDANLVKTNPMVLLPLALLMLTMIALEILQPLTVKESA